MKKRLGLLGLASVGLMSLMVAAGSAVAQDSNAPAPETTAEQPQAEAPAIPEELATLLADERPLAELDEKALRQRARRAQKALDEATDLPQDVRDRLVAVVSSAQTELKARKEAEQAAQPVEEKPAEQAQAPAEAPAAEPVAPAVPAEVQAFIDDQRPASELSDDELRARFKSAREIGRNKDYPENIRQVASQLGKAARTELQTRDQAAQQPKVEEPKPVEQAAPVPEPAPEQPAVQKAEEPPPAPAPQEIIVEAPKAAEPAAAAVAPAAPPPVDKQEAKELDGNKADPAAEALAKAFLNDGISADTLSDDDLRKRLDGMREVMAGNELSRDTERALRQKLKTDRDVLRQRLALAEAAAAQKAAVEQQAAAPAAKQSDPAQANATQPEQTGERKRKRKFNLDVAINIGTPAPVVLRDRRQSDELEEVELRRRIEVFREAERDRRIVLSDREFYGETMRRDREVLRRRMLADRQTRRAELAEDDSEEINIELNDAEIVVPARRKRDVFVAEVEDDELEQVLIAPPTRKQRRRLTVEEASFEPEVRKTIPRIEVDTIRFGFNEAFVREEEVGNLDRVAEVIEKILRKYPREVFLIEGHTDAVGSDIYNAKLSKARAEAIKKALTIYYVIPPKNLKTVGLGERYLKIPTAEAEAENRRVSISRATALVGEVD